MVDEVTPRDDGLEVVTVARMEREAPDGMEGSEWRITWADHRRPQAVRCLRRAQEEGLVVVIPEEAIDGGELVPQGMAEYDDDQDEDDPDDEDDLEVMGEDELRAVVRGEIKKAIAAHELRVAMASGVVGLLLLAGTWHAIWLAR